MWGPVEATALCSNPFPPFKLPGVETYESLRRILEEGACAIARACELGVEVVLPRAYCVAGVFLEELKNSIAMHPRNVLRRGNIEEEFKIEIF